MRPNLLIYTSQSPFDPTSGAAQSTRIIGECLALAGYSVRWIGTTACENRNLSLPEQLPVAASPKEPFEFDHRGIRFSLFDVDQRNSANWNDNVLSKLANPLKRELSDWNPDLLLTYGDNSSDRAIRQFANEAGVPTLFALHNASYTRKNIDFVSSFLVPTEYLKKQYENHLRKPIIVLPPPLDQERIANRPFQPSAITFINPEPAKGAILVAQLIKRFSRTHPDVPFLVVGGRVPAEAILKVATDAGVNLSACNNLYAIPPSSDMGEIYAETKILLMPSVVKEAAGRCALEAMLNGSVALVSDQGGLPEICGSAGFALPPPPPTTKGPKPAPAKIVEAWARQLQQLLDNEDIYDSASAASRLHAQNFRSEALLSLYKTSFDRCRRNESEEPA